MSTKTINDIRIIKIHEMSAKTIGLLIGILCLGLATYHLVYVELKNAPIEVQNTTVVQPATADRQIWIAVSRVGLFMHPMRDCVESLNVWKGIPIDSKADPKGILENRTSSIDKYFHNCCHFMPIH
jgi:hypothetical protein